MRYHPVFLDVRGRACVVIGGSDIARMKVESLLAVGARVTVVSPTLVPALAALAEAHEIVHHARPYRNGDLVGATLAYVAVDEATVQTAVATDAAAAGVLLNVVDVPALCTFITPAIVRRGAVTIAISTGGASPALARRVREDVETQIGPEYEIAATILARVRPLVRAAHPDRSARARTFARLVDGPLLEAVRTGDDAAVDAVLREAAGEGATLAALGMSLS